MIWKRFHRCDVQLFPDLRLNSKNCFSIETNVPIPFNNVNKRRKLRKVVTGANCQGEIPRHLSAALCSMKFLRPGGFEPPTYGLEGRCSIQLSYGRIVPAGSPNREFGMAGLEPAVSCSQSRRLSH